MIVNATPGSNAQGQGAVLPALVRGRLLGDLLSAVPVGARIPATVLTVNSHQVVISLRGASMPVAPFPNARPGQRLNLQLLRSSPDVVFELLDGESLPMEPLDLAPGMELTARVAGRTADGEVLLQVGDASITATADADVSAGEILTLRVTQTEHQINLQILERQPDLQQTLSSIVRSSLNALPAPREGLAALEQAVNQVLQSVITTTEAKDRPAISADMQAPVMVKGPAAPAASPDQSPALPKLTLDLTVPAALDQSGSPLPSTTLDNAAGARHADPSAMRDLAEQLQAVLKELVPEKATPSRNEIVRWLEDSGLFYETKLAEAASGKRPIETITPDLKATLLQTSARISERGLTESVSAFRQVVEQSLSNIELQQATNVLLQNKGQGFQFQVPFWTPAGLSTAVLEIEPDASRTETQSERTEHFRLLFSLTLDHLGQTHVDALVDGRAIQAVMFVEHDAGRETVEADLSALAAQLADAGFEKVDVDARPLQSMSQAQQQRFGSLHRPPSLQVVNARA